MKDFDKKKLSKIFKSNLKVRVVRPEKMKI